MKDIATNDSKILTIKSANGRSFLRRRMPIFHFNSVSKEKINETIRLMRRIMDENDGIGLAANQIGLEWRLFVGKHKNRFYAIFNPEIVKTSKETSVLEEGCLSVPGVYGLVNRPEKITLVGQDRNGKKIKIKARGLLARIFQHEVDHLNGRLFIDKAANLRKYDPTSS